MYLDCIVDIPDSPGKISKITKGQTVYVRYVVERTYNAEKKYTSPNHRVIGKLVNDNKMIPNENFLKYFGEVELPELRRNSKRSCKYRPLRAHYTVV